MSEDGAERSHEATPQKLEDARKKGEIAKSQDLMTSGSYLGVFLTLLLLAPATGQRFLDLGGALLQDADALSAPLADGGPGRAGAVLVDSMAILGMLVAAPAVMVLVMLAAQQAFTFAPSKLGFKLSRISILANAKNKFGPTGLFEFVKSGTKMLLFCALLAWFLARNADRIVAAAATDARTLGVMLPRMLSEFAVGVVLVSAAIALVDYLWQRHSHLAKNRMTRQDVIDEMKKSEGDPQMKGRRRQRAQEIAMNKMIQDVPDATVIVVNPTHYAVALRWSPMDPSPPICLAKGVDNMAARIREAATEAGIPIFSDPPTARALHATVEVGEPIDRAHFAAVAVAIRFARKLNGEDRS